MRFLEGEGAARARAQRCLETATAAQGADASTIFTLQQHRAWNYILLFYREQGEEGSRYVTPAYLTGLARQIPGLDVPRWRRARFDPRYGDALIGDARDFASLGIKTGTPTLVASGPDGRTRVVQEPADDATVERMIRSVA